MVPGHILSDITVILGVLILLWENATAKFSLMNLSEETLKIDEVILVTLKSVLLTLWLYIWFRKS